MLALAMSYRTVLVANAVRGRKEILCSVQPFNLFDSVDPNKIILALENYELNGTSKVRKFFLSPSVGVFVFSCLVQALSPSPIRVFSKSL